MQHLMLDCYNCKRSALVDRAYLEATFAALPQIVAMEQVSPTLIYDIKTSNADDDGMSGFIVIATSHVAFHAWPYYGMLNFDIFSCEPFNEATVIEYIQKQFSATSIEKNRADRGLQATRPQSHVMLDQR